MLWVNKPTDGGHLILTTEERAELIQAEPYVRRYMGAEDFIDGAVRYCLWLVDATPAQLRRLPLVQRRLRAAADFRRRSVAPSTQAYANRPGLFRQIAQPEGDYLLIPLHISEARRYLPISLMSSQTFGSNAYSFVPNATAFHFGVLTSSMHMAWIRQVVGRIKPDCRYSSFLVYKTFP